LDVVFDQVGTPTYAGDLAKTIERVITVWEGASEKERAKLLGIYNFSNEGVCSWFDFATEIVKHSGNNCRVNPVTSDKFVTKAVRPAYSVLDKGKIKRVFGVDIRHWSAPLEEKGLWKKIN
jgi:dTDP-4-dehydrorhamnose reductase